MFTTYEKKQQQGTFALAPKERSEQDLGERQAAHWPRAMLLQRALGNSYLQTAGRVAMYSNELGIQTKGLPLVSTDALAENSGNVVVRRAEASKPSCPGSREDFCQPFASRAEARSCHEYLRQNWLILEFAAFGGEVALLYQAYVSRKHGESLQRRIFSSPSSRIVQGFIDSSTTNGRQRELANQIKAALPSNCPNLEPNKPTDFPISQFLAPKELEYPINFNDPMEIPGHIAGGVGSSDAGPDLRRVSGYITFRRDTDTAGRTSGVRMVTHFNFLVRDAIDFCPGDLGTGEEQKITIPLSRLEATGLFLQDEPFAYDMPFEVRYTGNPIDEDIDLAIVRQCFPEAPMISPPAPVPPAPIPPPGTSTEQRPEERK